MNIDGWMDADGWMDMFSQFILGCHTCPSNPYQVILYYAFRVHPDIPFLQSNPANPMFAFSVKQM